jgi:hypothetical protein
MSQSSRISQREARRMRKELRELRERDVARVRAWSKDYVGGVCIVTMEAGDVALTAIRTARALGHAVVVTHSATERTLYFNAVKAGGAA